MSLRAIPSYSPILANGGSQSFEVSRNMDAFGALTSLTYPAGGGHAAQTVTTQMDALASQSLMGSALGLGTD